MPLSRKHIFQTMSKDFEEELAQRLQWLKKHLDESFALGSEGPFVPKCDEGLVELEKSVGHQLNVIELLWYRNNGGPRPS